MILTGRPKRILSALFQCRVRSLHQHPSACQRLHTVCRSKCPGTPLLANLDRQFRKRRNIAPFEEPAHNSPGVKRAARRTSEFLCCMAARSRALCAFEEPAHNSPGVKRAARRTSEFLCCMAARSRALCAFEEPAHNSPGVKRAARRTSEFLCCMPARSRALCALSSG